MQDATSFDWTVYTSQQADLAANERINWNSQRGIIAPKLIVIDLM